MMGSIRLWGRISSINVRKVLWTLQEVGAPFERIDAGMAYGIDYFMDRLTAFHEPMEALALAGNTLKPQDLTPAKRADLETTYAQARALWRSVEQNLPDLKAYKLSEAQQAQFNKGMADVSPSHTGLGAFPLYRQAEVPFSGGSDHYIFADPTVGVPMPMLIQWPDRYYHTSADTPDRVDPHSLARAGVLSAAYAYWIASAGADEAAWLGYEMTARFKADMATAAQAAVTRLMATREGDALGRCLDDADRRLAYRLDRQEAALSTLERLGPVGCLLDDLCRQARAVQAQELDWVREAAGLQAARLGLSGVPEVAKEELSDLERQAAALIPVRLLPGPVSSLGMQARLSEEERNTWRGLQKVRQGQAHTLTSLGTYWADGRRTILDIADRVEMEVGVRDVELLLCFFELVAKVGWARFAV